MKIAVTGENEYAEFFLGTLVADKNRVTMIDRDKGFCERVCDVYDIDAILGDPCQECVLKEAGIRDSDVIVALKPEGTDNFRICQVGKKIFGIRKTLCFVRNPKSVELFKKLGVNQAVSISVIIVGMLQGALGR